MCETLYEDHNLDIVCLMPTNVYGFNDNFDKLNGHVIPAMISKFIDAKKKKAKFIKLLGTGKPIREFIHSDDLAEAIVMCLNVSNSKFRRKFKSKLPMMNVGTGETISISNLSKSISKFVNFDGKIIFDKSFPDGTYIKNLNSKNILNLRWKPKIKLQEGLKKVIQNRFY